MCDRVRISSGLVAALFVFAGVAFLACFAASASATDVHVYSHSFGAGELSLTSQSGIAVNRETDDLYVADTEHSRIAKFTGSAGPAVNLATVSAPTSIAVDNSNGSSRGDIYVVEGGATVSKLDPTGALVTSWGTGGHLTGLTEILGIAVDPAGNLWVLSQALNFPVSDTLTARTYSQAGVLVNSPWSWSNNYGFSVRAAPVGIAVDSVDALYAMIGFYTPSSEPGVTFSPHVRKFGPAGETLVERLNSFSSAGIAIDPSNDDVYFGRVEGTSPPNLFGYSSADAQLEAFGGEYEGPVNRPISEAELHRLQSIASIAVGTGGSVDVADWKSGQISVYDLEEVVPPTVTIEPPNNVGRTSAHIVGHINPGVPTGSPPSHDVRWEFSCTPECPGHIGYVEVGKDGSEQVVEATLTKLEAGSEYSVHLLGENRGGSSKTPVEPFKTAPAPPSAETETASEVVRGEATLHGTVNSNGLAATYHFEYTPRTAFEAEGFTGAAKTAESEPLPAIAAPHQVSARIGGLQAGVEYLYRVVATNALETTNGNEVAFHAQVGPNPLVTDCPNQELRTGVGARLPDCRAYEMVTPIEKGGSLVEPYAQGLQAAADGSGVTWFTGQSATGVPSAQGGHQGYAFYLSTLAGESWTSQRLLAPQQYGETSALVGLTGDERYALIETAAHSVDNGAGEERFFEPALYLLDTADHDLSTIVPPQVGQEELPRAFALDGASADDSLIFFESHLRLTSNATPEKNNLYVWNRESGALTLAGVLPGAKGEAPTGGSFGGAYSWWGGYLNLDKGGAEEALYVEAVHAISETGDAVYFTAGETDQLYLRHGLTGPKPTTVRVSVANAGVSDSNGQKPAAFQEATPDGSKAFFLSSGKLTQNANTGSADEGSDLYRYDSTAKTPLVDVSPLLGGAGARVQGLLGVSADGRSGYLVAKGVLAAKGVEGDSNVYHFQEEENGTFAYTFVADLGYASGTFVERDWSPTADSPKTSRVSKDGGTVLFMSHRTLTGLPEKACIVQGSCMQIYRYSMSEGSVECLSCNPTGEGAPLFGAELTLESEQSLVPENHIRKPGNAISGILPANLSSSGTRVFFQSSESLLPEDVNGAEPRQNCGNTLRACVDVYEWEAVGTGSCRTPNQANGCLYLLSSGESDRPSYFINASADGSSAFILTSSSLVPADRDELTDVYDVREDGGLAAQHASAVKPCGSSETCRGPVSAVSPVVTPGSSVFVGLGNFLGVPTVRASAKPKPEPKPCKKGSVRKHDKCVKKPKKDQKKKGHADNEKKHRSTDKKHSGGAK